jgi:hypothetical protein
MRRMRRKVVDLVKHPPVISAGVLNVVGAVKIRGLDIGGV